MGMERWVGTFSSKCAHDRAQLSVDNTADTDSVCSSDGLLLYCGKDSDVIYKLLQTTAGHGINELWPFDRRYSTVEVFQFLQPSE